MDIEHSTFQEKGLVSAHPLQKQQMSRKTLGRCWSECGRKANLYLSSKLQQYLIFSEGQYMNITQHGHLLPTAIRQEDLLEVEKGLRGRLRKGWRQRRRTREEEVETNMNTKRREYSGIQQGRYDRKIKPNCTSLGNFCFLRNQEMLESLFIYIWSHVLYWEMRFYNSADQCKYNMTHICNLNFPLVTLKKKSETSEINFINILI